MGDGDLCLHVKIKQCQPMDLPKLLSMCVPLYCLSLPASRSYNLKNSLSKLRHIVMETGVKRQTLTEGIIIALHHRGCPSVIES